MESFRKDLYTKLKETHTVVHLLSCFLGDPLPVSCFLCPPVPFVQWGQSHALHLGLEPGPRGDFRTLSSWAEPAAAALIHFFVPNSDQYCRCAVVMCWISKCACFSHFSVMKSCKTNFSLGELSCLIWSRPSPLLWESAENRGESFMFNHAPRKG
jgi:hypothetical protein